MLSLTDNQLGNKKFLKFQIPKLGFGLKTFFGNLLIIGLIVFHLRFKPKVSNFVGELAEVFGIFKTFWDFLTLFTLQRYFLSP